MHLLIVLVDNSIIDNATDCDRENKDNLRNRNREYAQII